MRFVFIIFTNNDYLNNSVHTNWIRISAIIWFVKQLILVVYPASFNYVYAYGWFLYHILCPNADVVCNVTAHQPAIKAISYLALLLLCILNA